MKYIFHCLLSFCTCCKSDCLFHFAQDDYLTTTILALAALPEDIYEMLLDVFRMYSLRELEGQSQLSSRKLNNGADCKPGNFKDFIQIQDRECQEDLLQDLTNRRCTLKNFTKECEIIKRRQKTQEQFVLQTNAGTWSNAVQKYPAHTTVTVIDRFTGVNFKRSAPEVWNNFIASAKKFKQGEGKNTIQGDHK